MCGAGTGVAVAVHRVLVTVTHPEAVALELNPGIESRLSRDPSQGAMAYLTSDHINAGTVLASLASPCDLWNVAFLSD